jgi:hypothetical protein
MIAYRNESEAAAPGRISRPREEGLRQKWTEKRQAESQGAGSAAARSGAGGWGRTTEQGCRGPRSADSAEGGTERAAACGRAAGGGSGNGARGSTGAAARVSVLRARAPG